MEFRIILLASFLVSAMSSSATSKQYRSDYEYNENTDAFYKLHTENAYKMYASEKCIDEGSELLKMTSEGDLKQIHAMMKKFPDLEGYIMIDSADLHHESVEDDDPMLNLNSDYGSPNDNEKLNVVNRKGEIQTTSSRLELPFVCKVKAKDAPYNDECGVYSNDYESKISTTGSCYRVSKAEVTWNEAYASCQAEAAHLVILNNAGELEVLYNMLKDKPHHSETQYFAGVRAVTSTEPRVFKTIFNQTLEEVGYGPWDEGEPNDYHTGEDCVALDTRRQAKYNDVWCYVKMKYVCESSGRPQKIRTMSRRTNSATPLRGFPVSANIMLSMFSLFSMYFF